jgi:hypothetical protein
MAEAVQWRPDGLEQSFEEMLHLGRGGPLSWLAVGLGDAGAGMIELPG